MKKFPPVDKLFASMLFKTHFYIIVQRQLGRFLEVYDAPDLPYGLDFKKRIADKKKKLVCRFRLRKKRFLNSLVYNKEGNDKWFISSVVLDAVTEQYSWNRYNNLWIINPSRGGVIDPINCLAFNEKNWPFGWPFISPTYGTVVYLGSRDDRKKKHRTLSPDQYLREFNKMQKTLRKKKTAKATPEEKIKGKNNIGIINVERTTKKSKNKKSKKNF